MHKYTFTIRPIDIAALAIVSIFGVGCKSNKPSPHPVYSLCETSNDCNELLPDCQLIDPGGTGFEVSMCTRDCSEDFTCPNEGSRGFPSHGTCLAVDSNGHLSVDGSRNLCFPRGDCQTAGASCLFGGEEERVGECMLLPYDDANNVWVCVDVEPFYNRCVTDGDCSARSPVCRNVDLIGTGTPVSVCTRFCDETEGATCLLYPGEEGPCLGLDDSGMPDSSVSERVCLPGCPFLNIGVDYCTIGSGISGMREGKCEYINYEVGFDPIPVCVEILP